MMIIVTEAIQAPKVTQWASDLCMLNKFFFSYAGDILELPTKPVTLGSNLKNVAMWKM